MIRKILLAVSLLGAAIAVFSPGAYSTPEIAQKEERSCVTCHTAVGRSELNDAGRYYRDKQTLEGFPGRLPPRNPRPPAP